MSGSDEWQRVLFLGGSGNREVYEYVEQMRVTCVLQLLCCRNVLGACLAVKMMLRVVPRVRAFNKCTRRICYIHSPDQAIVRQCKIS
jgi:hypothetical protein